MNETRQQVRRKNSQRRKQNKAQHKEMNQPVSTKTFIQYAVRMESNLSILTNFIKERYPVEFEEYINKLQAEADEIENKKSQDAEIISETVLDYKPEENQKGDQ